jgi:hypothetical protein
VTHKKSIIIIIIITVWDIAINGSVTISLFIVKNINENVKNVLSESNTKNEKLIFY